MKILISGSQGLIGSSLIPLLKTRGYDIIKLIRKKETKEQEIYWNLQKGEIDKKALEGIDIVIHLAGENIADGRWTTEKKGRIRYSRVRGTELLCKSLSDLTNRPELIISASATGYYGNRGNEIITEESSPGEGFLSSVCRDWEEATKKAYPIPVAIVRFGMVLTPKGGALCKMLTPFKLGLGGILGTGKQYMSWISLDDVTGAILHIIEKKNLTGPFNIVSPGAVTNKDFTKILARELKRPAFLPVPSFALRTIFGEMADEVLLSGADVKPVRLIETGYNFKHKTLEEALKDILKK